MIRKGEQQLNELKEAGLSMVYMGAESGDETILKDVRKGITKQHKPEYLGFLTLMIDEEAIIYEK